MSLLRRLLRWFTIGSSALPPVRDRSIDAVGDILRHRLSELDSSIDWPGKDVLLVIGRLERELRLLAQELRALETPVSALGRRAHELRTDIESVMSPDGRLAKLVAIWPARWADLSQRFVELERHMRERCAAAQGVLDTARDARVCMSRVAGLRDRYGPTQPDTLDRALKDLDIARAFDRIETPRTAASALARIELAEEVLAGSEHLLVEDLLRLRDVVTQLRSSNVTQGDGVTIEAEIHMLRGALPLLCTDSIKASGRAITNASVTHFTRMQRASDRAVGSRIERLLGERPTGPLLYWARLHYSKARLHSGSPTA